MTILKKRRKGEFHAVVPIHPAELGEWLFAAFSCVLGILYRDMSGQVGTIPVRDDGTCLPDHFCKCGQDGIATLAEERGFDTFYVTERISGNVVSVELGKC